MKTSVENLRLSIGNDHYMTGPETCRYLHISLRTLRTLRDTRQIPFTVVGGRTFLYPDPGYATC